MDKLEKWEDLILKKHGLYGGRSMEVQEAIDYVNSLVPGAGKHGGELLTAAFVMYNSVINHYETKMICTRKEK